VLLDMSLISSCNENFTETQMPTTYLDSATVTEILRFRPVYIATQFVRDYDNATSRILAVQFSFETAVLNAMQTGFEELSEINYNPHFRWTSVCQLRMWNPEDPQHEWHDGWIKFEC
jgi:hypothetical protein